MKKRVLAVLMAVATMAAMVGCGDSATPEKAESTEGTESSGGKVWVIATDTAFKPFEYTDDNGDFVGIDME